MRNLLLTAAAFASLAFVSITPAHAFERYPYFTLRYCVTDVFGNCQQFSRRRRPYRREEWGEAFPHVVHRRVVIGHQACRRVPTLQIAGVTFWDTECRFIPD